KEGEAIPKQYSYEDKNLSPALHWSDPPAGTRSIALICDDPDAPRKEPWVHWVVLNLPPDTRDLPEGASGKNLPSGGKEGKNDYKEPGYGGPNPPSGKPHRYHFKVYALDTTLNLDAGATKADVEKAMKGHVLAEGQLMGTYQQ